MEKAKDYIRNYLQVSAMTMSGNESESYSKDNLTSRYMLKMYTSIGTLIMVQAYSYRYLDLQPIYLPDNLVEEQFYTVQLQHFLIRLFTYLFITYSLYVNTYVFVQILFISFR